MFTCVPTCARVPLRARHAKPARNCTVAREPDVGNVMHSMAPGITMAMLGTHVRGSTRTNNHAYARAMAWHILCLQLRVSTPVHDPRPQHDALHIKLR
eukprot:12979078-Alexandrium_andersonii.AAC.1